MLAEPQNTSHTSKKVGEHFIRILQTMVGGQIRSGQAQLNLPPRDAHDTALSATLNLQS
jgi:hypothetical protein